MVKRDSLAFRTMVAMARQRPEFNEQSCRALLEMVAVTDEIRALIHRELRPFSLTEAQFAVLLVLLALDPEPVLPSTLADHAGVTRASVTEVLDHLQSLGLTARQHSKDDRRNRLITLTAEGRKRADDTAVQVLRALARIARALQEPAPQALLGLCSKIARNGGIESGH